MIDFDYSELEDMELTLETEDGEEIDLELAYVFEYKEQDFAAFGEVGTEDDEERSVYFFFLNLKQKRNDVEFEYIDDDELAEELLEVFMQILASQEEEGVDLSDYGIEDEDDDEEEEDDDDDSRWDQFIHKKLED